MVSEPALFGVMEARSRVLETVRHRSLRGCLEHGRHRGRTYRIDPFPADPPLAAILAQESGWPSEELRRIALALADALVELHAQGVVHGHICPDTVVLSDGDRGNNPVLVDCPAVDAGPYLPFVAPEVALGQRPDPRSDLFGLGVTLTCLARGKALAPGSGGLSWAEARPGPALLVPADSPGNSDGLRAILLQLVDRSPSRRPRSATHVAGPCAPWACCRPAPACPCPRRGAALRPGRVQPLRAPAAATTVPSPRAWPPRGDRPLLARATAAPAPAPKTRPWRPSPEEPPVAPRAAPWPLLLRGPRSPAPPTPPVVAAAVAHAPPASPQAGAAAGGQLLLGLGLGGAAHGGLRARQATALPQRQVQGAAGRVFGPDRARRCHRRAGGGDDWPTPTGRKSRAGAARRCLGSSDAGPGTHAARRRRGQRSAVHPAQAAAWSLARAPGRSQPRPCPNPQPRRDWAPLPRTTPLPACPSASACRAPGRGTLSAVPFASTWISPQMVRYAVPPRCGSGPAMSRRPWWGAIATMAAAGSLVSPTAETEGPKPTAWVGHFDGQNLTGDVQVSGQSSGSFSVAPAR